MINTFEFTLTDPLKYGYKGEERLGFLLTLKAPTAKHRDYLIKLKQQFFKALAGLRNNVKEVEAQADDSGELDGSQVMMMLYMSGIDMVEFQNTFRALLLQGLVHIEDLQVTPHLLDQLGQDEVERLMGEYMSNFLLSSWTGILKKN